jgi:ABC-type nitrate/sulfonate/bicarbonate transport system substrate-binding protein
MPLRAGSPRVPRFAVPLALLSVCLLFASCNPKTPPTVEKVTVAVPTLPHSSLFFVAKEKEYFREEGLEVDVVPTMYGKVALDELIAGKVDFAFCGETPLMFAVLKDAGIFVVADMMNSAKDEAIVARKDRGIVSPSDLKGKTVGFSAGTVAEYFLDIFLTIHSVPRASLRVVHLKPDEMGDALRTGKVDAVAIWNPYVTAFGEEFGEKAVTFYGETIYTSSFPVTTKKVFARERPGAVKKFLRSLLKAEKFMERNPKETLDIVARSLRVGKGELANVLPLYDFRLGMGAALLVNLESQARWAIRNRLSDRKEIPNFLEFFYLDGLMAVKPDAVSVTR